MSKDIDDDIDMNNIDHDVEIESVSDDENVTQGEKTIVKERKPKKIDLNRDKNIKDQDNDDDFDEIEEETSQYKLDILSPNEIVDNMRQSPEIYQNELYKEQATKTIDLIKHNILSSQKNVDIIVRQLKDHITDNKIQKAERTELLGTRAQHIAMGGPVYTTIVNESDPLQIATKELKEKKFPMKLVRYLNEYECEVKDPNEMTIIWDN